MGWKEAADAILSGCNDVLIARHPDGTLLSTSFCVRFGRLKIRNRDEKFVRLECNGVETNVFMVVAENGECTFADESEVPEKFKQLSLKKEKKEKKEKGKEKEKDKDKDKDKERRRRPVDLGGPAAPVTPSTTAMTASTSTLVPSFSSASIPQPQTSPTLLSSPAQSQAVSPVGVGGGVLQSAPSSQSTQPTTPGTPSRQCLLGSESPAEHAPVSPFAESAPSFATLLGVSPSSDGQVGVAQEMTPESRQELLTGTTSPTTPAASPLLDKATTQTEREKILSMGAPFGPSGSAPDISKLLRVLGHKQNENIPDHKTLTKLGLKDGRNDIRFLVPSKMRGTQVLFCRAYVIPSDRKVVISDIDGTITKSNVGGQIAGFLGRDFSHQGIAQFYTDLAKKGHQLLYLTSRPITSNISTREYVENVRQACCCPACLPENNNLTSPSASPKRGLGRRASVGGDSEGEDVRRVSSNSGEGRNGGVSPTQAALGSPVSPAHLPEATIEIESPTAESASAEFDAQSPSASPLCSPKLGSPPTPQTSTKRTLSGMVRNKAPSFTSVNSAAKEDKGGEASGNSSKCKAFRLPPGPVVACPDFVFEVLRREIKKEPHMFKIPALMEILDIFQYKPEPPRLSYGTEAETLAHCLKRMGITPAERDGQGRFLDLEGKDYSLGKQHPFVAAFGNAPTDLISYYCVGVPLDRIYIVNPKSEIRSGQNLQPMKEIDANEFKLARQGVNIQGWIEARKGQCFEVVVSKQMDRAEMLSKRVERNPPRHVDPNGCGPQPAILLQTPVVPIRSRAASEEPSSPNDTKDSKKKKKLFGFSLGQKNSDRY